MSNIDAMPHIAPRLLLAFCLVLNGIGNAMAAASMPAMMGHAAMAVDAAPQVASACADGEGDASKHATAIDHAAPATAHPAACEQDCCQQSDCSCPCMQWVQATLLDVALMSAPLGHSGVVAAFPTGHPTPALLHPIRPPIG